VRFWGPRPLGFAALCALLSCVPPAPEPDPLGGFSIRLAPTPATAGVPFMTADGWEVKITKAAVRVGVLTTTSTTDRDEAYVDGAGAIFRLIAPRLDCEIRVSQLPIRETNARLFIQVGALPNDKVISESCGLDADFAARFAKPADNDGPEELNAFAQQNSTASVGFAATGVKNGREVSIDIVLDSGTYPLPAGEVVEVDQGHMMAQGGSGMVLPDQGVPLTFRVYFETIFGDNERTTRFGDIADADTDGDGVASIAELGVALSACHNLYQDPKYPCPSVLGTLAYRASMVLYVPTTPPASTPTWHGHSLF
jgi:hypothetical protein